MDYLDRVFLLYEIQSSGWHKVLAEGFIFECEKVAICWRGDINSIVIHDDIEDFKKISCPDPNKRFIKFIEQLCEE